MLKIVISKCQATYDALSRAFLLNSWHLLYQSELSSTKLMINGYLSVLTNSSSYLTDSQNMKRVNANKVALDVAYACLIPPGFLKVFVSAQIPRRGKALSRDDSGSS